MNARLAINLREGIVEAEGTEEFVRAIYQDFKERVSKPIVLTPPVPEQLEDHSEKLEGGNAKVVARRKSQRRTANSGDGKPRAADYKPSFKSDLDLSALDSYYAKCAPATHSEKILVFATFLRDQLKMAQCTADDIYTCYFTFRDRTETPKAFLQAFRDAQSKTHYIDYVSPEEIRVTIAGNNFFNQTLSKRAATK
jgi:hypothetical protein